MRSAVAITHEIDDLELAVSELTLQIREKLQFERNSVGIAYCDADMDVARFGELLHAELGIDIVGCTTTATIGRYSGYNDMGALLSVLTADDVAFSIGSTGEVDSDNFEDAVKLAYKDARTGIQDDPKLIMVFSPYSTDFSSDNYMDVLSKVSGGISVFGGVATDHFDLKYQKTFYNGQEYLNGLVFMLLAGNVKPVFSLEHHFGTKLEKNGVITKSTKNIVERVDKKTFKEFVTSIMPVPDVAENVFHFQSVPFVMEMPDYEKDEQPVVRALCAIDCETEAGSFLSKMPEGSKLYLSALEIDNLSQSCNGALSSLVDQMTKSEDYKYSIVFISTCNGRHLMMGGTKNLESDIVIEKLRDFSPELNAVGYYAFGEMCPVGKRDGVTKNRYHNMSFALCAI